MNSNKSKKAMATIVAILLLIYSAYQVHLNTREGLTTETAMFASISDVIDSTGFAIRSERIITESYTGVLNYSVSDGNKVSAGSPIAKIFGNENDATAESRIGRINSEIENLKSLSNPGTYHAVNSEQLGKQTDAVRDTITTITRQNEYNKLAQLKYDLLTAMNRKLIVTGEESSEDYAERIAVLENEKATIKASAGSSTGLVSSPVSGYFVSYIDGFENAVSVDEVESLTPDKLKELMVGNGNEPNEISAVIGKLTTEFEWYLACVLNEDDVAKLENFTSVEIEIPFVTVEKIPARIIAKNRNNETGETALILECSYINSEIAVIRNEAIKINIRTYSGLLVNEKAIHFEDVKKTISKDDGTVETVIHKNVKGIYVKFGDRIQFVQVFSDKTINGYAICKIELDENERERLVTGRTIQFYDEVIVEGTDLYDGKIAY